MRDAPAISVLMSAYNTAAYLRQSLDSILAQTFGDFEFVIIDDGSTDRTLAILREYERRDTRLHVVSRPNTGLTVALNEALALARAPLIARMDGDDIATPDRFEKQITYMSAHPDCVLLGSRVDLIDPFGGHIALGDFMHHTHAEIDAHLLRGSGGAIVHPVTMMRTDIVRRIGGYREQFNNSEDLDLFLRLAEVGQVHNLEDVLLKYRRHPGSVSHQKRDNQLRMKRQIVAEAHQRRGLIMPDNLSFDDAWQPRPHDEQFREWGWKQLKAGNTSIARKHAWAALRHGKTNRSNWKLLLCALRGR